jgi:hypothetical protein
VCGLADGSVVSLFCDSPFPVTLLQGGRNGGSMAAAAAAVGSGTDGQEKPRELVGRAGMRGLKRRNSAEVEAAEDEAAAARSKAAAASAAEEEASAAAAAAAAAAAGASSIVCAVLSPDRRRLAVLERGDGNGWGVGASSGAGGGTETPDCVGGGGGTLLVFDIGAAGGGRADLLMREPGVGSVAWNAQAPASLAFTTAADGMLNVVDDVGAVENAAGAAGAGGGKGAGGQVGSGGKKMVGKDDDEGGGAAALTPLPPSRIRADGMVVGFTGAKVFVTQPVVVGGAGTADRTGPSAAGAASSASLLAVDVPQVRSLTTN